MPFFPGRGKDTNMLALPIVDRSRQGGGLLAGLGIILVVGWMLASAWSCACVTDDPVAVARSPSAPSVGAPPMVPRANHPPEERFSAARTAPSATITPVGVGRSRDRRADLMDMATSFRWHRSAAPDLPLGSNITGTSAG
jgi:hypothetical protein